MTITPKKNLRDIIRISPIMSDREKFLRMDMNESLCEIPAGFVSSITSNIDGAFLSRYPNLNGVYSRLAKKWNTKENQILLTNGSDSASKLIFDTFISEGEQILITKPTFQMHRIYANIVGAQVTEISYGEDFVHPLDQILNRIDSGTKLVIIVNPNNPFGTLASQEKLLEIVSKCSEVGSLCFIDEAYGDYSAESMIPAVANNENLIVTRTFSKAYGLAAIRVGYLVASEHLVKSFKITQPTFDVNGLATLFVESFLDHPEVFDQMINEMNRGKIHLICELEKLRLPYFNTETNFILVKVGRQKKQLVDLMKQNGILLSATSFELPFLEEWLRVSVGPVPKMNQFILALQNSFQSLAAS